MGSFCLKVILSGFAAGLSDTRWVTLEPPSDGTATSRLPALPSSDATSSSVLFASSATTFPEKIFFVGIFFVGRVVKNGFVLSGGGGLCDVSPGRDTVGEQEGERLWCVPPKPTFF